VPPMRNRTIALAGTLLFSTVATAAGCQVGSESVPDRTDAATGPAADGGDASALVTVQILAINDFHGNLEPPTGSSGIVVAAATDAIADAGAESGVVATDAGTVLVPTGGAAYLAAHINALRRTNPANTVIVSAGDLTGASPLLSNLFKDEPSVLAMNSIGLDFEAVGNHDFDRGLTELLRLQKGGCSLGDCDAGQGHFAGASYQYLAANVLDDTTNQTIFPPYAIKSFGAVRVAFVGMTLEGTPSVETVSAVQGLSFKNEAATVNALVPKLVDQGVSAIVVVVHQGGFQDSTGTYDSCAGLSGDLLPILKGDPDAGTPGLDPKVQVVITAHTHQPYDCTIDGRLVTSAASYGRVITKIDLTIDPASKTVTAKKAKNVAVTRSIAPDLDVAAIVAKYQSLAAPLANRIVGYVTGDLTSNPKVAASASCETPLGDVIADAQLAATSDPANGGAVVALMNPGGIRGDLLAKGAAKADGTLTYAETFAVQPFANNLVTMTLTGDQILKVLAAQFGGAQPKVLQVSSSLAYTYAYDATAKSATIDPAKVTIAGAPLDPAKTYRVTVNAFLAGGGDSFAPFKDGTDRVSGGVDLDALVAYLGQKSTAAAPLAPPALGRVTGDGCK